MTLAASALAAPVKDTGGRHTAGGATGGFVGR